MKMAIPTRGGKGKRDRVSEVFAKAPYITIVEVEEGKIMGVEVKENEALAFPHGAGPIVVKTLKGLNVEVVISGEMGPGAKTLMEISGLSLHEVEPGVKVSDAVQSYMVSIA